MSKGIRAQIVKSNYGSANGGVSDTCREVTIVGPGFPERHEPSETAPAVRLVKRVLGGKTAHYFEPVDQPEGMCGPMASGNYVHAYGDEFSTEVGFYGAVPLHDRFETWAQYEAMSR